VKAVRDGMDECRAVQPPNELPIGPPAVSRRWLLITSLVVLSALSFPSGLAAQGQGFSNSADYKSMLDDLHRGDDRPSRMSAGSLLDSSQSPADLKAGETASLLTLETGLWKLEVTRKSCGVSLTNKETGLTWRLGGADQRSNGISWGQNPNSSEGLKFADIQHVERSGNGSKIQVAVVGSADPAILEISVISRSVIRLSIHPPQNVDNAAITLPFNGAGPFFGLGERFDRVKLDGLDTVLRPHDTSNEPGHNWTYIPVPFLFTPRGLGLYLDTAAITTFDLSGSEENKFSIQIDRSSVDFYFFVGTPKDIVGDYTSLTGGTPLSAPWAFGVWICSYQGPQQVLEDARKLRQEKIPSSAIWVYDVMGQGDIMGWPLWWTGYYPDPRQLTDTLHTMGFKVLTYVHPYLRSVLYPYNLPDPSFEEGVQSGLMVLDPQGKPVGPKKPFADGNIDFTKAANVNWWELKVQDILLKDNFDGWMEDYGDTINDTDRFAAGVTGREMANLYPLFYHKITNEIARKAKPDVVEFDRSGYAGSQGYSPVIWGGDQSPNWSQDRGLPSVVRAGITAGLSGFAVWCPDIEDNTHSKDLWTRWLEFGALTPVMRNHLWNKPDGAVTLWSDPQNTEMFRQYAGLHISLFPYFYTYANQAVKSGIPIMRDLLLEFPNDPLTYDLDAEYMLGDKMLVAPVITQGATVRSLYLPQGAWVNYWTGEIMDGARQVTISAPLQQIPIMVRAGSVLPFISPNTETLVQDSTSSNYQLLTSNLTWRVFPAEASVQNSFTLYDGTVAQANEEPSRIEVRVEHSPVVRHYEVMLPVSQAPHEVLLGGKSITEMHDLNGQSENTGWRIDPGSGTLHVFLSASDFDLSVTR
jgi:alpha-glucosidase (family GH31 glycosyl hydrolase)